MYIDTHSHIYSEEFNGEIDEVINRSVEQGIEMILTPNIDSSSIKRMLDTAEKYPGLCIPMMGVHPTSIKEDYKEELEMVEYWLGKKKFIAIGEIGIDLYWDKTFRKEQEEVFLKQIQIAHQLDLPVSVHTRESFDITHDLIKSANYSNLRGVFHCFSGSIEQAKKALSLGFMIGVGGTVTFKNSGIDQLISQLKPEHLMLETDSPYLAPSPLRGKRNESGNLTIIAQKVAEIFNMPINEIARITSNNAKELFQLA
ncbi:MAG: TatD family hydrolase [Prolixibacteraceae bacterium]|nr:TatD family hydrolase [Prolixibacteraceae bacterium]